MGFISVSQMGFRVLVFNAISVFSFSYIVAASFIGGGNRSTCKSL